MAAKKKKASTSGEPAAKKAAATPRKRAAGAKAAGGSSKPAAKPAAGTAPAKRKAARKAGAARPAAKPKAPASAAGKAPRAKRASAPKASRPAPAPPPPPPEERLPAEPADAGEAAAPERKKRAPRAVPAMAPRRADGVITVAASPDADDAFMFYALEAGKVDTEDRRYEVVRDEIQVLNEKAEEGVYDVTAVSFGAWPWMQDRYLVLPCGASFADGRGPVLVARTIVRTAEVPGLKVAVPGERTTAALVLRLWLPQARLELIPVPFDQVVEAVRSGRARAGVLIHEAQLTWREDNLVRIVDFGQWWGEKTEGLPLPLGANAIRRDVPEAERAKIALDIKRSIAYALGHREEALEHAMRFAKGLPKDLVDRYISMYVNELSLDLAERGRQAIQLLYDEAGRYGLLPRGLEAEFA